MVKQSNQIIDNYDWNKIILIKKKNQNQNLELKLNQSKLKLLTNDKNEMCSKTYEPNAIFLRRFQK